MGRYDGERSYLKLIKNVYGVFLAGSFKQNFKEYNIKIRMDEFVLQSVFLFARFGNYGWDVGTLNSRAYNNSSWEDKAYSTIGARDFDFNHAGIYPLSANDKGYGISVRCEAKSLK